MKYKITHTTTYQYHSPVRVCHNLVLLTPREEPHVRCVSHRLQISPVPQISNKRTDYFGNHLHAFSIEESHRQLRVTASSRVQVMERPHPVPANSIAWNQVAEGLCDQTEPQWLEASLYRFDSRRIVRGTEFEDYAKASFAPGTPILQAVMDLTTRIHRDFKYDPTATMVHTKPIEAFKLRRGVCQDFAHIAISCLRSVGLPARYVSGTCEPYRLQASQGWWARINRTPGCRSFAGMNMAGSMSIRPTTAFAKRIISRLHGDVIIKTLFRCAVCSWAVGIIR